MSSPPVQPIPVQSSLLNSVSYQPEQAILDLEFRPDGTVYRYFNVPAEIHTCLLTAISKGACFNQLIRNRFPCQRLHRLTCKTKTEPA